MIRTRICLFVLLLTPMAVYWQTIFHEYGFRDDYSNMREAREEQGKLVRLTSSYGRPLYGALLETSFGKIEEIETLQWLRVSDVLLLTLLGLVIWRQLYQSGWKELEAAAIGLGITLLPAAQLTVSWAITWPHTVALLLAVAGFSAIETELERGGLKRAIALVGGAMIYALAALIYQSNALFAVVPIAGVLLIRSGRGISGDLKWAATHLSALLAGLAAAYLLVRFLFSSGIFPESIRMQIESNPLTKLGWFFWKPLANALALYALRDDYDTGAVVFWCAVALVIAIIGFGYKAEVSRPDSTVKKKLIFCLAALPFLAHAVSLAAAERSTAYRTLFPLAGLVVVMVVFAMRSLLASRRINSIVYHFGLCLMALVAAITAHLNSFQLIAEPQGYEWEIIRGAVIRADFKRANKVYIITPTLADRVTERVYGDEFGSLSTDSDWASKEMFKAALFERFRGKLPPGGSYTIVSGKEVPEEKAYNIVIDMRALKQRRER
jgi:hypothetical protein